MGNYVIFLDKQEKPLDYQAVEKALAAIGIKTGGWKRLSERDEAYFDGTLCEDCMDEDDGDEEDGLTTGDIEKECNDQVKK